MIEHEFNVIYTVTHRELKMYQLLAFVLLMVTGVLGAANPPPPGSKACVVKSADIAIILDASGSVSSSQWSQEVDFAKAIVNSFDIGPKTVRVGLIQYSDRANLQFNLARYTTKVAVLSAMTKMSKISGGTQTDEALQMARTNLFTTAGGDRTGVPNIAFVMTDGSSNDKQKTIQQANLLKKAGVTVFSVGIGSGANQQELLAIATDASKVYTFADFNKLTSLQATFAQDACKEAVKLATTPIPAPTKRACVVKSADIAIILDASGSVDSSEWSQEVNFAKAIVNSFDIGPTLVRVGLIQYSAAAKLEFSLSQYTTEATVLSAMTKMKKVSGGTQTDAALLMARTRLFSPAGGDRAGVPNIAFVMTDGSSNDKQKTIQQAKLLKQAGVTVFAVGVGSGAKQDELRAIATDKSKVYTFADFNKLKSLQSSFSQAACKEAVKLAPTGIPIPTKVKPAQGCTVNAADIVFAVDTSSSVGEANFNLTRLFLQNMMELFDFSKIRVGIIKFNDAVTTEFTLKSNNDLTSAQAAITAMKYAEGAGTVISGAIKHMREKSFTAAEGDRLGASDIGIIVTDGQAKDSYRTYYEANLTRNNGITLFSIGIGKDIDIGELERLASKPSSSFVSIVRDYKALSGIKATLAAQLCKGYQLPATTTPSPTLCKDTEDCSNYVRNDVCLQSRYRLWATRTCPVFCDLCPPNSIPVLPTNIPCIDNIPNCAAYTTVCTDPNLRPFAEQNCLKHCNLCTTTTRWTQPPTTPTTTSTTTPTTTTHRGPIIPTKPTPFVPVDPLCYDKDRNCAGFGKDYCTKKDYIPFMLGNCALFCGFCIQNPNIATPTPVCEDDPNTDCSKYDDYVCYDPSYEKWAQEKCAKRCCFCGTNCVKPTPQPAAVCEDLQDCTSFGGDVCTDYKEFSAINCRAFCNICTPPSTTKAPCVDKRDCSNYDKESMCVLPDYRGFALGNCRKTCNLCDV